MFKTIIRLFDSTEEARAAVQALRNAGINRDRISVITQRVPGEVEKWEGPVVENDAMVGAAAGAVAGGVGGLLLGLGLLAVPGIGPLLAAGPIATALAGAGIGAVTGGLVGGLVSLGISHDDANAYAEGVRRGGTLLLVNPPEGEEAKAREVLDRHRGVDMPHRVAQWRDQGWDRFDPDAPAIIVEEEIMITRPRNPGTAWPDRSRDPDATPSPAGERRDQSAPPASERRER